MWLIDTATEKLKFVPDPENYRYAILSHTWDRAGESSFQDFQSEDRDETKLQKVKETCRLARYRGIPYAWVDSCCIDKTSSAELSEAINSMFRWYQQAEVCFVHLVDLESGQHPAHFQDLQDCNWFRRGWTLQELIASEQLELYDKTWVLRGNKESHKAVLSRITGIDLIVLEDYRHLPSISVARRMCWASKRRTTRVEDQAYCLFGVFDVNLPLIYGEGKKAFLRLQEAIVQNSNDLTLFAWTAPSLAVVNQRYCGIFAEEPSYFELCQGIYRRDNPEAPDTEVVLTNLGLAFKCPAHESESLDGNYDTLLSLQCFDSTRQHGSGADATVFIRLVRTSSGYVRHFYDRQVVENHARLGSPKIIKVQIPKSIDVLQSSELEKRLNRNIIISIMNNSSFKVTIRDPSPSHLWLQRANSFMTNGSSSFVGVFKLSLEGGHFSEESVKALKGPKWWLTYRDDYIWPDIFVVLGYQLATAVGNIQPWAVIFHNEMAKRVADFLSQSHSSGTVHMFDQIRTLIESQRRENGRLPAQILAVPSVIVWEDISRTPLAFFKPGPAVIHSIQSDTLRISLSVTAMRGVASASHNLEISVDRS